MIRLSLDARSAFLRRTYTHLFLAVAGFVGFELFLFNAGLALPIARGMLERAVAADPRRVHGRRLAGAERRRERGSAARCSTPRSAATSWRRA